MSRLLPSSKEKQIVNHPEQISERREARLRGQPGFPFIYRLRMSFAGIRRRGQACGRHNGKSRRLD